MTKYLAGVLSVIAAGVLLIAYGLLSPRTAAFADDPRFARPMLASDRAMYVDQFGQPQIAQPAPFNYPAYSAAYPQYVPAAPVAQPVRTVAAAPVRQASSTQRAVVERAPKRDWKKTALVIGGSTAAGAGVGALVGGKKGALIGAAVGGGASTIYESTKR